MNLSQQNFTLIRDSLQNGDYENALRQISTIKYDCFENHHPAIEIAILFRDSGKLEVAADILQNILKSNKIQLFALYELAVLEAIRGRHVEALLYLERILASRPYDDRSLQFAARMSARIGDRPAADNYLRRLDETLPGEFNTLWLKELIVFMDAFPAGVADRLTQLYERDDRYVTAEIIASWASISLANHEGFSLIRLGDGEGAFCRISSEDEDRFTNIYEHCRQDRARVWFNNEIDIHNSGFTQTAFTLRSAIQNANVVGMPYRTWVEHEYKYCSATGIIGLVNALRLLQIPSVKLTQSWTTQLVHMDLMQQGVLERLVRQHRNISLISCLPDAANAIKQHFELEDVKLYRIPGEKLHKEQLGAETAIGHHYPGRFNELMKELEQPLNGKLFLVAGGLLGKIYCDRIKKSGGVALDIGSVADIWMGKATRPGADPRYKLN